MMLTDERSNSDTPPPDAHASDMTRVDEGIFKLTLPGRWNCQVPSNLGRWTYSSDQEQLTVSRMDSAIQMDADQQLTTLERVTEHWRRAEREMPDAPDITMTDPTFAEFAGIHVARYNGAEPASHRCFHCLLFCGPTAVTIFYYESICLSEEESELRARPIFDSIGIVG